MPRKFIYLNLEAEIIRAELTREKLAELMNISIQTLKNKLANNTEFTLSETQEIKTILSDRLDQDLSIEYLFKTKD